MGERRHTSRQCHAIPNSDRSPLYDVRNPAGASVKDDACEVMFSRTMFWRSGDLSQPVFAQEGYAGHASPFGSCVAAPRVARRAKRGGARRDRTDDLMLAKHALSQLSYGPVPEDECCWLSRSGLPSRSARQRGPPSPFGLWRGSLRCASRAKAGGPGKT
jgi:hypothetical protein